MSHILELISHVGAIMRPVIIKKVFFKKNCRDIFLIFLKDNRKLIRIPLSLFVFTLSHP